MKTGLLTREIVCEVNNLMSELCLLYRWSSVTNSNRYNELNKQGLNTVVTYFLASIMKHEGQDIVWTNFPKIILYRAFQKSVQCDIQEESIDEICKYGITREEFNSITDTKIAELTSKEFLDFLKEAQDTTEYKIFKAATKVATYIELEELRGVISIDEYVEKIQEASHHISMHIKQEDVKTIIMKEHMPILKKVSALRNRIRWTKRFSLIPCSVLGHMFDTAIFAYLMQLEREPEDEEKATKIFFIGAFHDFPEAWTGDMPSPVKDAIPGLRDATEKYENEMLKKNVYSALPSYMIDAIKDIMLEEEVNKDVKFFLKQADYFSADSECYRQIIAGSRDSYFKNVLIESYKRKENLSPAFRQTFEEMYKEAN